MTQSKKTKQEAFKAFATEENELIAEMHNLIHTYEEQKEDPAKFEEIISLCSTLLMKSLQVDPLEIIANLDEIERAVNIIKPKQS